MDGLQKKFFYIKEASEITGVSEQLIRKWEKRYQIIQPQRLDNGYRIYTYDNLLTLKEIQALRTEGKTMPQAIEAMLERQDNKYHDEVNSIEASPYVKKMIKHGSIYDESKLMFLLKQSNYEYGLDLFLRNTIQPFLEAVGDLWKAKKWDESQETVSSLVVRDYLTELSRNFNNDASAPHALGFCLPNEHHEIPLQILLLQLKMRGWRTTRIGASPKFSAIEKLIIHLQPNIVLFSASTIFPFKQNENLLDMLDELAAKYTDIPFFIGGKGAWDYTKIFKPKHLKVSYTANELIENEEKMYHS